jgi:transposase
LNVVEQTLPNWVKAQREGRLKEVSGKAGVTAEQMEIRRLRAELARMKRSFAERSAPACWIGQS